MGSTVLERLQQADVPAAAESVFASHHLSVFCPAGVSPRMRPLPRVATLAQQRSSPPADKAAGSKRPPFSRTDSPGGKRSTKARSVALTPSAERSIQLRLSSGVAHEAPRRLAGTHSDVAHSMRRTASDTHSNLQRLSDADSHDVHAPHCLAGMYSGNQDAHTPPHCLANAHSDRASGTGEAGSQPKLPHSVSLPSRTEAGTRSNASATAQTAGSMPKLLHREAAPVLRHAEARGITAGNPATPSRGVPGTRSVMRAKPTPGALALKAAETRSAPGSPRGGVRNTPRAADVSGSRGVQTAGGAAGMGSVLGSGPALTPRGRAVPHRSWFEVGAPAAGGGAGAEALQAGEPAGRCLVGFRGRALSTLRARSWQVDKSS